MTDTPTIAGAKAIIEAQNRMTIANEKRLAIKVGATKKIRTVSRIYIEELEKASMEHAVAYKLFQKLADATAVPIIRTLLDVVQKQHEALKQADMDFVCVGIIKGKTRNPPKPYLLGFAEAAQSAVQNANEGRENLKEALALGQSWIDTQEGGE